MECHQLPWTAKDDPGHLQGVGTSECACSLQGVAFVFNVFLAGRNQKKRNHDTKKGCFLTKKVIGPLDFFLALHLLHSEKECFLLGGFNSLARSPDKLRTKKTSSEKSQVIAPPVTSQQSQLST